MEPENASSAEPVDAATRLGALLDTADSSVRLRVALDAGTNPHPSHLNVLIEQCAVEPDFYVRDMLTWALTRHPESTSVPRLLTEAASSCSQARSQALHTLSKIRDPRGWEAITPDLLREPDEDVVRSAWRAAVVLVPADGRGALAACLSTQLGRGDRDLQRSLSRALAAIGDAAQPALAKAAAHDDPRIRAHAIATQRVMNDPGEGFDAAVFEAHHIIAELALRATSDDASDRAN